MKILKIKGDKAVVKAEDHTHMVDLSLVKDAKIGDYIIAHNNIAFHKISKDEALETLELSKKHQD